MELKSIYQELELANKPTTYSISKLRSFTSCSYKYKLKYLDKLKRENISDSLILGSLIHDSLEHYYLNDCQNFVEHYVLQRLKNNLIDLGIIPKTKQDLITKINSLISDCKIFMQDYLSLYLRSTDLKSWQPIRTKAGNIPKLASSTYTWKQSAKFFNLQTLEYQITRQLKKLNPEIPEEFSLPQTLGQAYGMAYNYITPPEYELSKILALEFPISDYNYKTNKLINPFKLPDQFKKIVNPNNKTETFITGYIDYVGYVNYQGENLLAVIDYKSGKSDYTNEHLLYNPQLLFYALAYSEITNNQVDLIGIHNLKSNNLALVKIDSKIQYEVLTNFFFQQEIIEQKLFFKHLPESKYSPCLNSFNKPCPYLKDCHPNFKISTS